MFYKHSVSIYCVPGTVLGMRAMDITKTQSLPLGLQSLVGEADRLTQLNVTISVMKTRLISNEGTKEGPITQDQGRPHSGGVAGVGLSG